jgi:hypothetical protein
MKTPENGIELCKKLESAMERQKIGKFDDYTDEICEVCGQKILRYIGKKPGVICSTCYEFSLEGCGHPVEMFSFYQFSEKTNPEDTE